jgi:hypothetical protein
MGEPRWAGEGIKRTSCTYTPGTGVAVPRGGVAVRLTVVAGGTGGLVGMAGGLVGEGSRSIEGATVAVGDALMGGTGVGRLGVAGGGCVGTREGITAISGVPGDPAMIDLSWLCKYMNPNTVTAINPSTATTPPIARNHGTLGRAWSVLFESGAAAGRGSGGRGGIAGSDMANLQVLAGAVRGLPGPSPL